LLDLQAVMPSPALVQVGTFLAIIYFEEVNSMANSRLSKSKPTIMVVDDNQDLVEIVRLTLEAKGFKVSCAYNGQELLDSLENQKPDLILLDVMMPRMDGLQVLKRVKGNPSTVYCIYSCNPADGKGAS
jgi:PleD family two-component response regulator